MGTERVSGELPVAIAGFMGVGKSTVGRAVAASLGRTFYDSDEVVVERLERPIAELFEAGDEPRFRAAEAAVIAELVEKRPAVVLALGGGALEYAPTRAILATQAVLVHLDLPWRTIAGELEALRADRPLLATGDEADVHLLYEARRSHYLEAPVQVAIGRDGPEVAASDVLKALVEIGIGLSAGPDQNAGDE